MPLQYSMGMPELWISGDSEAEGQIALFVIHYSGLSSPAAIEWGTQDGEAKGQTGISPDGADYIPTGSNGWIMIGGSGSIAVPVQTLDDGEPNEGFAGKDFSLLASVYEPNTEGGNLAASNSDIILETEAQQRFCTCNCGCGNVEASVDQATGAATVGDGKGPVPDAFSYNSSQRPHPMVNVLDTLSSTVASATNIEAQLSLLDLSGNTVWSGAPVYYSPAGYTQGQQVDFAGQIDASGLADGNYESVMTITENYPNGQVPIIRGYGQWVGIQNRDNSPYGSGWAPHNVDRLVIQSGGMAAGVSLEDGSGNVYFFEQNGDGVYAPPDDSPQFASLVKNQDGTFTLTMLDHSTEQFSGAGLLTKSTDKDGNWLDYSYNNDTTLAAVQDNVGRTTAFAYSGGYLASSTDFAGCTTSYVITGGQLTKITRPDPGDGEAQQVTTLGYDPATGLLDAITDSDGTTSLTYSQWRAVTKIVRPDNTSTEYNTLLSAGRAVNNGGICGGGVSGGG